MMQQTNEQILNEPLLNLILWNVVFGVQIYLQISFANKEAINL